MNEELERSHHDAVHSGTASKFVTMRGEGEDGELLPIGPVPSLKHPQLMIPSSTNWVVEYQALDVRLELKLVFSGERLEIDRMAMSGINGHYVQSRDLTQLALPSVIQEIASQVIPGFDYWTLEYQDRVLEWKDLKVDDEFLAQLMWVQQVIHGNPRQTLMAYFQIPRSTSTYIIRRLRKMYSMPDFK